MDFAVVVEGEKKGRWVLAVDPEGGRLLISSDDQSLCWVPMDKTKVIKAANPDMPQPVVVIQPQPALKLVRPQLIVNGQGRGR